MPDTSRTDQLDAVTALLAATEHDDDLAPITAAPQTPSQRTSDEDFDRLFARTRQEEEALWARDAAEDLAAAEDAQQQPATAQAPQLPEADPRDYRLFTRRRAEAAADTAPNPEAAALGQTDAPSAAPLAEPAPAPLRRARDLAARATPDPAPAPRQAPRQAPNLAPDPISQAATDLPPPLTDLDSPSGPVDVPAPALGRAAARSGGRVKTRLLGFNPANATDPFAPQTDPAAATYSEFPVGWLAVISGPGRGATFTLHAGVSTIGRGADQGVPLDFGDTSISRDQHAAIAFDPESQAFYVGHGGKANLVRLNGRPVLSTEVLNPGDTLRIGETELRFVPLCDQSFSWDGAQEGDMRHAAAR
ncbi:FHA domain-containing protein [Phaeobacter sp. HF9A]|nr:FHA domain-containing protein [Phaeobacter sp. HF9A]